MTKYEFFTKLMTLPDVSSDEQLAAFCEKEIMAIEKRKNTPKKPSKTALLNQQLIETMLFQIPKGKAMTIQEIILEIPDFRELSVQKVSRLLKECTDFGTATKEIIKRKTYYTFIGEVNEESEDEEMEE